MTGQTTIPLVDRLRAQAARHREHATGLASAALLEEAATTLEAAEAAIAARYTLGRVGELVAAAHQKASAEAQSAERERCAKIAEGLRYPNPTDWMRRDVGADIAEKIREG